MRRRSFLFLGILTVLTAGLLADEFKFPLKSDSVRFAAIGDMGTGEPPQYETAQQMLKARPSFPFDFVIMLGDNIYGGSKPADFDKKFAVPYKPLIDGGVKFYASLGNHDNTNERFYKPFDMNGESYHLQEGQRALLCSEQQLHGPEAGRVAGDAVTRGRQGRLEDKLFPSSPLYVGEVSWSVPLGGSQRLT